MGMKPESYQKIGEYHIFFGFVFDMRNLALEASKHTFREYTFIDLKNCEFNFAPTLNSHASDL